MRTIATQSSVIELEKGDIIQAINFWMRQKHNKHVTSYPKFLDSHETDALIVVTVDHLREVDNGREEG